MQEYRTILTETVGEITEKKSRFIATVRHVSSEDEAVEFINEMKKKYWDARHNCSAYIIGHGKPLERCSDDGEPSRTAGMPMLDVIKGAGLYDVACVVTRYFGGILLGTGGLVRAYQGAVKECLDGADIVSVRMLNRTVVTTDYSGYGKLQYIAAQDGLIIEDTAFTDAVRVTLLLSDSELPGFTKKMNEISSGRFPIEDLGRAQVYICGGKPVSL